MKIYILFIFFLIFIFSITNVIALNSITGTAIDENMGISINVKGNPIIKSITPENLTYISNTISLYVSCKSKKNIYYQIDNGEIGTYTNKTLLSGLNNGQHFLKVNCTNDYNFTIKELYFKINTSILNISYDEFKEEYKGKSTDLDIIAYENLENISNLTFEDTRFGAIQFIDNINIINDSNSSSNFIDINSNVNVSYNLIEINSKNLPSLNKSATLSLYDLTFSNPRILKDGSICPSDICTKESYSEGILKFNVTHFTSYSTEETPANQTASSAGQISSGVKTKIGDGGLINKTTIPKVEAMLDINTRILNDWLVIYPGKSIMAEVTIYNFGTNIIKDVKLTHYIKNINGEVILKGEETIAVYLKSQVIKKFIMPLDVSPGTYIFHTDAKYILNNTEQTAFSEAEFEIIKEEKPRFIDFIINKSSFFIGLIIAILILVLLIFIILIYRRMKKDKKV